MEKKSKDESCMYWQQGDCRFGLRCRYVHSVLPGRQQQPSVPVCKYWQAGACKYGSACRFRHGYAPGPPFWFSVDEKGRSYHE